MSGDRARAAPAAPPQGARREYERRVHAVMAHIDRHLGEPLDLETLAAVAHFSPFHFHRLFRAWTGETLGDHLRRRRVEIGALRLLAQPRSTVLEIALAVGFGSGEAFARAFKVRFGVSPSAWREERKSGQAERNLDQAFGTARFDHGFTATHPIDEDPMNRDNLSAVSLLELPATPVAYFRHTGPYGKPVERFWMERVAPWMAENGLFGRERFGIAHDDPTVTEPAKCRYDAGVAVARGEVLSGEPQRAELPGGRYACARFEGTVDEIDAAWQRLLGAWLPASGLQLDARPFLERYTKDAAFDPKTGVFDCDLCIPVAPL